MSQEQQSSALPSYYGEKTPDGRIVKRPSQDLPALSSPPPRTSTEQIPPSATTVNQVPEVESASDIFSQHNSFSTPRPPNAVQRWGPLDRGSGGDRTWRTTPSRRRLHDEYYYPEYSGPERTPYYDFEDEAPLRRPVFRGSARDYALGPLTYRGGSFAEGRPRRPSSPPGPPPGRGYSDPSYDEGPYRVRPGSGGDGRGPPSEFGKVMRLPLIWWMNSSSKNHFVAAMGEFVGTTMFLFFAFAGTQVANVGSQDTTQNSTTNAQTGFNVTVLLYIALVFAFSLMVNVWIFFRISGGLFNPAVTLAMVMVQSLSVARGILLVSAQLLGSMFASYIVSVLFPTEFNVRTTLSSGTSTARGVFIEAILTAELVFTIFMLAKEKHKATFIAPVGIGLALFIGELVGVYYTGGSLNPARSFGPCVVSRQWDAEHWIYWVGPGLGAGIAVLFYKFIKILEYEMANPGQDATHADEARRETESLKNKESKMSLEHKNNSEELTPPKKRYTGD